MELDTENCNQTLKQLKYLLDKHKLNEVEELLNIDFWDAIEQDIELKWDIMILICQRLRSLNKYRFKTFELCQSLLIELANRCDAKELLVAFLAELENGTFDSDYSSGEDEDLKNKKVYKESFDNCIKALLVPIKIVINKIPKQVENNLKWVIGILNCHLLKISQPVYEIIDDKNILDKNLSNNNVQRFGNLLPDYLSFLSYFVEQYFNFEETLPSKQVEGKILLIKALLFCLYHPLMYMNLSRNEKKKENNEIKISTDGNLVGITSSKDVLISELTGEKNFEQDSVEYAIKISNLILKLEPNIISIYELEKLLYKNDDNTNFKMNEEMVNLSIGVLSYILFILNEKPKVYPSIYCPVFIFLSNIKYCLALLERREANICEKGLFLIKKLIFQIPDYSIEENFLDFLREFPLDKVLIKIIRFSELNKHRRTAFKIYKKLISMFNSKGRYYFIYKTSAEPNQFSGIKGYMMSTYKDFILDINSSDEFIDSNLENFIRMIIDQFNLKETDLDLIENLDSIMSFLNLIRFLLIWDKKNETFTSNEMKLIDENFFKKLRKKIEFSRNCLKSKLISTNENSVKKNLELTIKCENSKENLSNMFTNLSKEDEIDTIQRSLINIDMIESVLVRLNELIVTKE